jgi:hypothetical protein
MREVVYHGIGESQSQPIGIKNPGSLIKTSWCKANRRDVAFLCQQEENSRL